MSDTNQITTLLVGAHFRPPAKQLIAVLPTGAALILSPEPDNPYDSKAIKVSVCPAETVPMSQFETLAESLEGTGVDLNDLMAAPLVHLGYLPDSEGKLCRHCLEGNAEVGRMIDGNWPEFQAILQFAPDGKPQVFIYSKSIEN